jgi:hypothetical protein
MSDELDLYSIQKYVNDIGVHQCFSPQYIQRSCISSEELAFNIKLTNRCIKNWDELQNTIPGVSYVDILNSTLKSNGMPNKVKSTNQMETRLLNLFSKVRGYLKGKSGRKYETIASAERNFSVRWHELENFYHAEEKLSIASEKVTLVEKERDNLQKRCENLYQSLLQEKTSRKCAEENAMEYSDNLETLKAENLHLYEYVEKIEELSKFENLGKKIPDLKERQQRRKIQELKTKVQTALWFTETFGLKLSSVTFQDDDGKCHPLEYKYQAQEKRSFKDLPEDDQEKIQQILFITDKFCIGEAAYHELTMMDGGEQLPRSYLVKQCKHAMDQLCHISRTPGKADGAQLDFKSELQEQIKKQV